MIFQVLVSNFSHLKPAWEWRDDYKHITQRITVFLLDMVISRTVLVFVSLSGEQERRASICSELDNLLS